MLAEIQGLEAALLSTKAEHKAAGEREVAAKNAIKEIETAIKNSVNEVGVLLIVVF